MLTSEQVERLEALLAKVERWSPGYDHYPDDLDPDGDWVRYDDIAILLASYPALLQLARAVSDAPKVELDMVADDWAEVWADDDRGLSNFHSGQTVALVPRSREGGLMDGLTKNERRYLSRRACAWCDMPLNREGCGAIYERCSEETRKARRKKCLAEYKPRPTPEAKEMTDAN